MKNSFPKCVNRHTNKMDFKYQYQVCRFCVCVEKSFPHMYIYAHIYEELFFKTSSPTWHLHCKHNLFDWRLTHFGIERFICRIRRGLRSTDSTTAPGQGHRTQSSQTNNLQNRHLSLLSLTPLITRIGLLSSVSG